MAARKQLWHPDEAKQRIKFSQLINRLTKHALSDEPIMDNSQVRAALGLLLKVIPDMKSIEHSGSLVLNKNVLTDDELADIATRSGSRAIEAPARTH